MKNLCCLLLACGLFGCDAADLPSDGASENDQINDSQKLSQPAIPRPQPTDPKVPADAFPDVAAAVGRLADAAEANDGGEILRTCAWLKLQGNDAVQLLGELLLDPATPKNTRYHVCRALGEIGGPAVPLLIKTLDTASVELRIGVLNGLGRVQSGDQATNDRIAAALLARASKVEESIDTRRFALRALASLGKPAGNVAMDPLQAILRDTEEDNAIKGEARRTLKAIAPRRTLLD